MLGKSDHAKYPFTADAIEFVKKLKIEVKDLMSPDFSKFIRRAEERIEGAIEHRSVNYNSKDEDVEILSFPIAIMLTAQLNSDFLVRRYALAESKRAYRLLKGESERKIIEIAKNFGWSIQMVDGPVYHLSIRFIDYLRNAGFSHEDRWKLVNRVVKDGWIYLTRNEAARVLQEEVRRYIINRLHESEETRLPEEFEEVLERLRGLIAGHEVKAVEEELPRMVLDAFPPCEQRLYGLLASSRHLSHVERFALTSFLLNIGMSIQDVIKLFVTLTDFDERLTRYQVEHIAGRRGSGTKYSPPSCETLITHNVCPGRDDVCKKVRHPIQYYKIVGKKLSNKERKRRKDEPIDD